MAAVDILLPTCNRPAALAMTLCGIAAQTLEDFRLVVADQGDACAADASAIGTLRRLLELRGHPVEWHYRTERRGIAEQRAYLLERASAECVLYLDDDVFMEPWVLARLVDVLQGERCGFVGAFPAGLSFLQDVRPRQQRIEYWDGPVRPETVAPGSEQWERWHLHRAANLFHVSQGLAPGVVRRYKVAWIASCVLYDRDKLLRVGGFSFWPRLPRYHSGEEVLVQNLLLRRFGGCGIVPSGTYHAEAPSTVLNPAGTVDGHALALLDEMVARYVAA